MASSISTTSPLSSISKLNLSYHPLSKSTSDENTNSISTTSTTRDNCLQGVSWDRVVVEFDKRYAYAMNDLDSQIYLDIPMLTVDISSSNLFSLWRHVLLLEGLLSAYLNKEIRGNLGRKLDQYLCLSESIVASCSTSWIDFHCIRDNGASHLPLPPTLNIHINPGSIWSSITTLKSYLLQYKLPNASGNLKLVQVVEMLCNIVKNENVSLGDIIQSVGQKIYIQHFHIASSSNKSVQGSLQTHQGEVEAVEEETLAKKQLFHICKEIFSFAQKHCDVIEEILTATNDEDDNNSIFNSIGNGNGNGNGEDETMIKGNISMTDDVDDIMGCTFGKEYAIYLEQREWIRIERSKPDDQQQQQQQRVTSHLHDQFTTYNSVPTFVSNPNYYNSNTVQYQNFPVPSSLPYGPSSSTMKRGVGQRGPGKNPSKKKKQKGLDFSEASAAAALSTLTNYDYNARNFSDTVSQQYTTLGEEMYLPNTSTYNFNNNNNRNNTNTTSASISTSSSVYLPEDMADISKLIESQFS